MEPIHPGVILKEIIKRRSMTIKEFAHQANLSTSIISDICAGKSGYGLKTANALGRVTDISAERWMYLLEQHRMEYPSKLHPQIIRKQQRLLNAYKK